MSEKSDPRVLEVRMVPITEIHPNPWNPNVMSDEFFNMLTSDVSGEDVGFAQPILVAAQDDGTFRIIDGENRYEAARLSGFTEIPCMIAQGKLATDEGLQKIQTVRMNKLHGQMDKRKFEDLVRGLAKEYTLDQLADALVFTDPTKLEAMLDETRRNLPPEMRKEFDKAKEEIKTVDDLSQVLNRLFTRYGSTLPYRFMVLDFGGKKHMWIRFPDDKAYGAVLEKARLCQTSGVTFSSVLLQALARVDAEWIDEALPHLEAAELETGTEDSTNAAL